MCITRVSRSGSCRDPPTAVNTLSFQHAPRLLPFGESAPALSFHPSEGFALCLLTFPSGELHLTAYAEHRPTVPEFLGAAWHLPLHRILADFRRRPGKATLMLHDRSRELRQTGWCGTQDLVFEGAAPQRVRFLPQQNQWTVENPGGLTYLFAAIGKSAPRAWFLSEIRESNEPRFRFAYRHGRYTHLLEVRDGHGHCARFEHAPLRGDHNTLLLRSISIEGPKGATLGRLQLSYVLQPCSSGYEPLLHTLLLRENGASPRSLRCSIDYFPARRNHSRLLKALHFDDRSARLFVPGLDWKSPVPHPASHTPHSKESAMRVWHEEHLTLIAEQGGRSRSPSARFTLYSRGQPLRVNRRVLRHCLADLDAAICRLAPGLVLVAAPNRLKPGRFEVLLWQWSPSAQRWISHRRTVEAETLEFPEPDSDGAGLEIRRRSDPHTSYRFHWFDKPRAWSLTSMVPSRPLPPDANQSRQTVFPEQDSLFARRPHAMAGRDCSLVESGLRSEDQIDWQPGELFAGLEDAPELALIS